MFVCVHVYVCICMCVCKYLLKFPARNLNIGKLPETFQCPPPQKKQKQNETKNKHWLVPLGQKCVSAV